MKRIVTLVLVLAMAMGLCAPAVASAEENVELVVWILGPGEQADHDMVMAAFNEKLHETLPNITVDITIISGEIKDQLSRMWAAGERVDLCWIGWHNDIAKEARDGNILPLNDLLAEYGQGIIESLGEDVIENHRIDGEIYQLPSWQGMVGGRSALYLPAQCIEESGVSDTWLADTQALMYEFWQEPTVENQQKIFDALALYYQGLVDNNAIRKGIGTGEPFDHVGLSSAGGCASTPVATYGYIEMNDDTFTVKLSCENPLVKNYYKNCAESYDKGYIRSDIASATSTANWNDGLDDQDNILAGHNAWTDDYGATMTKTYGIPVEVLYDMPHNWYSLGRATGMCIPYTAEYPEEAMIFLNEMYTNAELYQLFVYGIEGVHWEENNDELNSINVFGGSAQPTSDFAYGQWVWVIGTAENCRLSQNAANDPAWYAELKALEENAYSSPLLNFNFDTSEVEAEMANLQAINKEYTDVLKKGYLGADEWEAYYNEYIELMKANGVERVIEVAQEQINEYVEANGITGWNYDYSAYLK